MRITRGGSSEAPAQDARPAAGATTHVPLFTPHPTCAVWTPAPLSDAEQAQLAALRERMPHAIARALGSGARPGDREHLEEFCDDACLVRYLRATRWAPAAAEKKLETTLCWRLRYRPHEIRPEDVEPESLTGKNYLNGFDRLNRPTIYLRPGRENTKTYDRQIRFLVFNLETATRCFRGRASEKLVLVIDYENWTPRTAPSMGTCKEILSILSQHYPERLGAAYMVNAPWIFFGFYKLITPFIDPVTKAKVRFVNTKYLASAGPAEGTPAGGDDDEPSTDATVDIRRHFHPDYLEKPYGGAFHFVYEHPVYWKHLVEFRRSG